jgi:hypothetical protein
MRMSREWVEAGWKDSRLSDASQAAPTIRKRATGFGLIWR